MKRGALKRMVEHVTWYMQSPIAIARFPGRNSAGGCHQSVSLARPPAHNEFCESVLTRKTKAEQRGRAHAACKRGVELGGTEVSMSDSEAPERVLREGGHTDLDEHDSRVVQLHERQTRGRP